MTTTAKRFAEAVKAAIVMPSPEDLNRYITATSDDGLKASGYEARVSGTPDGLTHPEEGAERRMAGEVRDDHGDLLKLRKAGDKFIDAIGALNAECCDAGQPDDWEEAMRDANVLVEKGLVQAALDVGRDVTEWVNEACDAVAGIERVRDRHWPHPPTKHQALKEERCCLSHARIGDYSRERYGALMVCKSPCYDLLLAKAKRWGLSTGDLAADPDEWPAETVLREHAIMEATGKRADFHRERTAWIETDRVRHRHAS